MEGFFRWVPEGLKFKRNYDKAMGQKDLAIGYFIKCLRDESWFFSLNMRNLGFFLKNNDLMWRDPVTGVGEEVVWSYLEKVENKVPSEKLPSDPGVMEWLNGVRVAKEKVGVVAIIPGERTIVYEIMVKQVLGPGDDVEVGPNSIVYFVR